VLTRRPCGRRLTGTRSFLVVPLAAFLLALGLPAPAGAGGGMWDNGTSYNERFPHGVGKKHAVDKTSGTPVTNFKRSNKKYKTAMNHNDDLDRDNDKIACEKA
jgi:hypothetical protein